VCVGQVLEGPEGLVTLKTQLGTERVIDMLSGEQLPRIC
jgi:hydrogenase expression/formation protein HypE